MNELGKLRGLLLELGVGDEALEPISQELNAVETKLLAGAAAQVRLQSLQRVSEAQLKLTGCPLCKGHGKHLSSCYLRESTGWDLLNEHECTLTENAELRAALAKHLPNNGKFVRPGRMSLLDRARVPKER